MKRAGWEIEGVTDDVEPIGQGSSVIHSACQTHHQVHLPSSSRASSVAKCMWQFKRCAHHKYLKVEFNTVEKLEISNLIVRDF